MLPLVIAVGAFVVGMKGDITGAFVRGLVGASIGDFVGDLVGASSGAFVGGKIGAPLYSTSIPLICGCCIFRTRSIVMAVSVTNVDTVTM